ncbi:hypothetical protein H8697_10295 [[Eubacterium] tenue]|nr:hypothetical protein [[Eubacterium] tenue]MBC8632086.1 hypothetical protein [[Eubacterium] tenue]
MDKLDKLYELCEENGIVLETATLMPSLLGLYTKMEGYPPIITLNKIILDDKKKTLEVLSEELGHHFTTDGNFIGVLTHYTDRVNLDTMELKALKWACNFLIPDSELVEKLKYETNLYDLADSLEVPYPMLMSKLNFIKKDKGYIKFSDKILYLYRNDNLLYHESLI